VKAKIAESFERIVKTGKAAGFLTANHDDAKWALSCGCSFVAIGSDMQILATQTRAYAADFKKYCKEKL
jgi:4-hydroxy-2-oxoheptanedioate aldolase